MRVTRGVFASVAVLAAAGISQAGPATATPPPDGDYVGTVVENGGAAKFDVGNKSYMRLSSCGPDCIHMQGRGWGADLHPEGNIWSGVNNYGDTMWFEEGTLAGGVDMPGEGVHLKVQMEKA